MVVLGVAMLLGLAALSLTFIVTLDSLGARNAQDAAVAEAEAEGALGLAAKAVVGSMATTDPSGSSMPSRELGPWPDLGLPVLVAVVQDTRGAYRLEARARVGRSAVKRSITVDVPDARGLVVFARP